MIKNFYAIYDQAVNNYLSPFGSDNDNSAKRALSFLVNSGSDSMFASQPKDFSLWHVGSFDTETGVFSSTENSKPIFICEAMSLANQEDK